MLVNDNYIIVYKIYGIKKRIDIIKINLNLIYLNNVMRKIEKNDLKNYYFPNKSSSS